MTRPAVAIQEIFEGIDVIDVDADSKQKFKQMVGAVAAAHGFSWIERAERIQFARRLLRAKVRRPVVRDRLMALYGISRPLAYRVISYAIETVY